MNDPRASTIRPHGRQGAACRAGCANARRAAPGWVTRPVGEPEVRRPGHAPPWMAGQGCPESEALRHGRPRQSRSQRYRSPSSLIHDIPRACPRHPNTKNGKTHPAPKPRHTTTPHASSHALNPSAPASSSQRRSSGAMRQCDVPPHAGRKTETCDTGESRAARRLAQC